MLNGLRWACGAKQFHLNTMSTKPEEFRNLDFDQDPFCLHQTKNEEETRRTRHQTLAFSYYLLVKDLPESQRADAVSSMVYEASARIRDPVYGSAGAVFQLQKQLSELQEQLAKAQAELVNMQSQKANLVALFCMEMAQSGEATVLYQQQHQQQQQDYINTDPTCFYEDNNLLDPSWSPLWC
ncbi:LOB domain-containing protein 1-like isoform X2 [Tripterygium wilfordii]|uniref:LOB domain-containing protein 1-like isoform X2 n=1 Tax=Tripterygium wilfordii TaxID=458696 RepID=UPI0018F7E958|nr:LOB domain-containing protein 1-like isoform X2 [Tripterygium wilfordii]